MPISGAISGQPVNRIEENGFNRITESGDQRILETPNAGLGSMAAEGTRTAFTGEIHAKNSSTWQEPATWVNDGGTWKLADTAYVHSGGIWKRIL